MSKKYKIKSSSPIFSMQVVYCDEKNENVSVTVAVDLANDRVYFNEKKEGVDYAELESEILSHAKPQLKDSPALPTDINKQIQSLRLGNIHGGVHNFDPNKNRK